MVRDGGGLVVLLAAVPVELTTPPLATAAKAAPILVSFLIMSSKRIKASDWMDLYFSTNRSGILSMIALQEEG